MASRSFIALPLASTSGGRGLRTAVAGNPLTRVHGAVFLPRRARRTGDTRVSGGPDTEGASEEAASRKGKPTARWGRKATGLSTSRPGYRRRGAARIREVPSCFVRSPHASFFAPSPPLLAP